MNRRTLAAILVGLGALAYGISPIDIIPEFLGPIGLIDDGGVLIGASVLKLLPEKLRFFDDYRLLLFGVLLIVMMRFRPEGLLPDERRQLEFHTEDEELAEEIGAEVERHVVPSLAGASEPPTKERPR